MLLHSRPAAAFFILLVLCAGTAHAADLLSAMRSGKEQRINITPHLAMIGQPDPAWTIDQVASAELSQTFQPVPEERLNFGFGKAVRWFRFALDNTNERPLRIVLAVESPLVDHVDLYLPGDDGFQRYRAGFLVPVKEREIASRHPAFTVTLPPHSSTTCYIRFQDEGAAPFSVIAWSQKAYAASLETESFVFGVYYGTMVVMAIYSLCIFLFLRLKIYLSYATYVAIYLLWQADYNGLATLYFWPDSPAFANTLIPVLTFLTAARILFFSISFLDTKKNAPGFHTPLSGLGIGYLIMIAASFALDYTTSAVIATGAVLLMAPLIFVTSIVCWRNGYRPARYFTLAWMPLLAGATIISMKEFGLVPSTFFTEHAIQIGSFLEIILLYLALLDQFDIMRRENQAIQDNLLRSERHAKEELEAKVTERTASLQELTSKIAKYLPSQFSRAILEGRSDSEGASGRRHLTVFFSDIVRFTELTDSMDSGSLTRMLNEYLDAMAEIALTHGGTIDKYMGDSILIFFGAPETHGEKEDAARAVRMALAMKERVAALQSVWDGRYGLLRPLSVRMGINSGYCAVGSFGSQDRLEYTVIGSQVNIAKRMEESAAADTILISQSTYILIKDLFSCHPHGPLQLKGIAYPIRTWEITAAPEITMEGTRELRLKGPGYSIEIDPSALDKKGQQQLVTLLFSSARHIERDFQTQQDRNDDSPAEKK